MTRIRYSFIARTARIKNFLFLKERAISFSHRNPAIAMDYLIRALGVQRNDVECLQLGVELGDILQQPALTQKCISSLQKSSSTPDLQRAKMVERDAKDFDGNETYETMEAMGIPVFPSEDIHLVEPSRNNFGRGMFAKRKLLRGQPFLEEVASICVPRSDQHCSNCLQDISQPVSCEKCGNVSYCSVECRDQGLLQYHAPICENSSFENWEKMTRVYDDSLGIALRMAGRLAAVATTANQHPLLLPPLCYLRGRLSYRSAVIFNEFGALAVGLADALRQQHFYLDDLIAILSILQCNAHSSDRGMLLFSNMNMLNHSCVPNCIIRHPSSNSRQLMTLIDIQPGEQLTVDYLAGSARLSPEERKASLRDYGFECRCSRCIRL